MVVVEVFWYKFSGHLLRTLFIPVPGYALDRSMLKIMEDKMVLVPHEDSQSSNNLKQEEESKKQQLNDSPRTSVVKPTLLEDNGTTQP